MIAVGDLDGDNVADLVVDSVGGPWLLTGADLLTDPPGRGHIVFTVAGPIPSERVTDAIGDVDGDGRVDLLVSAGQFTTGGGAADAWLLSGARLAADVLRPEDAFATLSGFAPEGGFVGTGMGDLDGDGLGEAVLRGRLFTGAALTSGPTWDDGLRLNPVGLFPDASGVACDLDGDGLAENLGENVLTGVGLAAGVVEVWISRVAPATVCAGDLDGDGAEDFAFGSPHSP